MVDQFNAIMWKQNESLSTTDNYIKFVGRFGPGFIITTPIFTGAKQHSTVM